MGATQDQGTRPSSLHSLRVARPVFPTLTPGQGANRPCPQSWPSRTCVRKKLRARSWRRPGPASSSSSCSSCSARATAPPSASAR